MHLAGPLSAGVTSALLLLCACGGEGESDASGEEDVQAFCAEAETVFTGLESAFTNVTDPAELPALLEQATSALQGVDPPAEIEASWATFADALGRLSQSAQGIDLGTPEGQDRFTQEYDTLMTSTADAQQDVDEFVTARCPGVADDSSSPTG